MRLATPPNLGLLLYKAEQILAHDKEFAAEINRLRQQERFPLPELWVITFPQMWPNTATGFDAPGVLSGQSFTPEYTTVVEEKSTHTYLVFFGDRPAYKVTDAKPEFFEDLGKHKLVGISQAKERY